MSNLADSSELVTQVCSVEMLNEYMKIILPTLPNPQNIRSLVQNVDDLLAHFKSIPPQSLKICSSVDHITKPDIEILILQDNMMLYLGDDLITQASISDQKGVSLLESTALSLSKSLGCAIKTVSNGMYDTMDCDIDYSAYEHDAEWNNDVSQFASQEHAFEL